MQWSVSYLCLCNDLFEIELIRADMYSDNLTCKEDLLDYACLFHLYFVWYFIYVFILKADMLRSYFYNLYGLS